MTINIDEINKLAQTMYEETVVKENSKAKLIDDVTDFLIYYFLLGVGEAETQLNLSSTRDFTDDIVKMLAKTYDGKTYVDRLEEYAEQKDVTSVQRVVTTESHRAYNTGLNEAGKSIADENGLKLTKTWVTMGDDKVRETHDYLEGITVEADEEFFTYDGDSALYPSGFSNPANNVNCRCYIQFGIEA